MRGVTSAWRASGIVWLVAIAAVTGVTALLLTHPQTSVFLKLVDLAAWLKGGTMPAVTTWPAWGYAWLIAWLPSVEFLRVLQVCIGVLALWALVLRVRNRMPAHGTVIAVLCVFAIPWYDTQLTLYPSGLAGSFALLALLCLDSALEEHSIAKALLAGVLVALAQNFRTEFVLLPLFIGICWCVLAAARIVKRPFAKPLGVFIVTALALQLPWAIFYHAQTGRFSLTESNFGHVLYVSLGARPSNPWGIRGDDAGAQQAVLDAGYSYPSLGEKGNQVLLRLVRDDIRQHPEGLVGRTVQQLRNTVMAPFNWGEPRLDSEDARDLDVLRQELKARLGVGVNVAKLNEYRGQGLDASAGQNGVAISALVYQAGTVGLGSLLLLLGLVGLVLALFRPALRPASPLFWLLGCGVLYKVLQDVLLAYQVNYLNNIYPGLLPLVAISLVAFAGRFRPRTRQATPALAVNDTRE